VQHAQPLGGPGHRHVEVAQAARRSGEDRGGIGDEHRVELKSLGLPGPKEHHRAGQVRAIAERHAGHGEGVGDIDLEPFGELAGAFGVPVGERGDDVPLEERPGPVVREPGGPRLAGGFPHDPGVQPERLAGELDCGGASGLPVTDGRREHADHHGPALDLLGERALGPVRRDPGEQLSAASSRASCPV
jgi:hypothetical protein